MSDVKKCIKNIEKMFKGLIPEDFLTDEQRGRKVKYVYISEDEKYNAICEVLRTYEKNELKNIQILLKCSLNSWSRLREFKAFVPFAISVFALLYSTASPFLMRQLSLNEEIVKMTNAGNQKELINGFNSVLVQNVQVLQCILLGITGVAILCILIYLILENRCSKLLNRNTYLLEIVNSILEEKTIERRR